MSTASFTNGARSRKFSRPFVPPAYSAVRSAAPRSMGVPSRMNLTAPPLWNSGARGHFQRERHESHAQRNGRVAKRLRNRASLGTGIAWMDVMPKRMASSAKERMPVDELVVGGEIGEAAVDEVVRVLVRAAVEISLRVAAERAAGRIGRVVGDAQSREAGAAQHRAVAGERAR